MRARRDFTVRKVILWESDTALDTEVNGKEVEYIRIYRSNDPSVGYNVAEVRGSQPAPLSIARTGLGGPCTARNGTSALSVLDRR